MSSRNNQKAAALWRQGTELSVAAPQVIAHRLARMAAAGPQPSARDQREFTRMVAEKQTAFAQAWMAMATQSMVTGPALAMSMARSWFMPWGSKGWTGQQALATQWQSAALGVMGKGLAPVRSAAVANAKRLNRL
ncbi:MULTISPECIES: polyhydroxyalkanoate granule-associated phasin [unclassified Acidovorax]|uniref:polyhydroxyalkanoate granule-associated phasin n=1 Tax=unclassified Acidovorax TaxID=2684926 RepID=UPI0028835341|nr:MULTISPECIES: polyhydroxyalkanoate granule-associated phasin [unclassified Acidovorax]